MSAHSRPSCENYEILISTWMDEELERDEQRELLDHVVRCPECRDFYEGARSLEGLVAMAGEGGAAELPSPDLWDRIRNRVSRSPSPSRSRPVWAWSAAAALLIGVALALVPWPRSWTASPRQVDLVLEENRGDMTEIRFLELAAEILRADRRYHFAMQEVMDKVIDDKWRPEGATGEGHSEESAKDEGEEEGSPFRV